MGTDARHFKFVDLLLHSEETIKDLPQLLLKHQSNINYIYHLPKNWNVKVIQHAAFSLVSKQDNITFVIRKGKNWKWAIYYKLFSELRKEEPDVILIHSMIYAWQIVFLRLIIGSKTKLIVQNHAEKPFGFKKKWIQKLAGKFISAFLFVSKNQAEPWVKCGIITDANKVKEVMEGSTSFKSQRKQVFRYNEQTNFIWVGRLDGNKDPLTILKAFHQHVRDFPLSKLNMIFSAEGLLNEVQSYIQSNNLNEHVDLIGFIEHKELEQYYNESDYFILGSHYEGSGYALCEAMACGCVPIITRIPSFTKMLDNGNCGYLFEPGDADGLTVILNNLNWKDYERLQTLVLQKFKRDLSFEAIALKIQNYCETQ